ncbi:MAG: hypothetical protein AAGE05_07910 [Pseudomonadota bacterium]
MASMTQNSGMPARSEERAQTPFGAQLRRSTGTIQSITVRNMSSRGLQATGFNAPMKGEEIAVRFANGHSVDGVVRWLRKGVFGLEFRSPVDVSAITRDARAHASRDGAV